MKQLLMAMALLALGACGDRAKNVGNPGPPQAELIVEAKNGDPVDYALWIEWQDETGTWNQEFLFALYGDRCLGPTQDFADLIVLSGVAYNVLLADPAGNLFDTRLVMLSEGSLVDLHYHILGGVLLPQS